jgi:hypothetical protein
VPLTDDQRSVYYGLWDMLSQVQRDSPEAKEAQQLYGTETMRAIRLLFDVYRRGLLFGTDSR